jgi:alkylation response protein AidB-like acyl-CoA dehydrogenase
MSIAVGAELRSREHLRDLARGEIARSAAGSRGLGRFHYGAMLALSSSGLPGLPLPADCGGGGDRDAYLVALDELAAVEPSLALSLAAHTSLAALPIALWGNPAQREAFLGPLSTGRRLGACAVAPPYGGGELTAEPGGGGWILSGRAPLAINAGTQITGVVIALCATGPGELSAFAVPAGSAGLVTGPEPERRGLRSAALAPLAFDGCRVGPEALLGVRGAGHAQAGEISREAAAALTAICIGSAQGWAEEAGGDQVMAREIEDARRSGYTGGSGEGLSEAAALMERAAAGTGSATAIEEGSLLSTAARRIAPVRPEGRRPGGRPPSRPGREVTERIAAAFESDRAFALAGVMLGALLCLLALLGWRL